MRIDMAVAETGVCRIYLDWKTSELLQVARNRLNFASVNNKKQNYEKEHFVYNDDDNGGSGNRL